MDAQLQEKRKKNIEEIGGLQEFLTHSHTYFSNFRLKDAINSPEELIDYCYELGLNGCVITDHEVLSGHVRAYKHWKENKDKFGSFKVAFGDEIYLVNKDEVAKKKSNNEHISFHHFILIAKDQKGYEGLKKISSRAWHNSFFFKGLERTPTYKDELEEFMSEYKGHIIATTACVGGEMPQLLIQYKKNPTSELKKKIYDFASWLKRLFGNDIYFELQPSKINEDQLIANDMILKLAKVFNVKCIVATDAHYLNKNRAKPHEIYLKSSEGEREVAEFYSTTYVMSKKELLEYFDSELLEELIKNTLEIKDKIQQVEFEQEVRVPKVKIPEFKPTKLFEPFYDKYEYIKKFSESDFNEDRYYLCLIADGMKNKNEELNEENLSRINTELSELYYISLRLKQPMSAYFIETKNLIDIMWEVSLIGVSRGSAACYYVNYLLDIVQINPLKYNLPHWRFLSKERPQFPDIDIDTEGAKRQEIIDRVKEHYGEENVLNMGTFTTEGTRSAILTSCRGFGIDTDIARNITNMVPTVKGNKPLTLRQCFFGDKEKGIKPAKEFIKTVEKYPGLKETMLSIEGLVSGRGQHASGVILFANGYIDQNAMMKTTSGLPVTQFDAVDSEYMGGLKYDFLSINALDRIRAAIELLLKNGKIEWQGSLRKTYNKYFHPDVLEMKAPEMFDMLFDGEVIDAFQFETNVGQQALRKVNARTFDELCSANSLMRLSSSSGETPLQKFIKFKNDISLWYKEMKDNGLNDDEIKVLEKYLLTTNGICDSQEGLMMLIMDEKISGYDLTLANKFRKAIAKQDQEQLEKHKELFYEYGHKIGTRDEMLDYVWNYQFKPSFGYAFSKPHTSGYTLILMIEMNICYRFGPIYWKTACLSINSGLIGDSTSGTDYGSIAKSVGDMKGEVIPPDINLSNLGFTPLEEKNKILYGLKPIPGLGLDVINTIISNRPYKSFNDFYERMIKTKLIPAKKGVILIKAGCFDSFIQDRRKLMIEYVKRVCPKKEKLTMTQLPVVISKIDKDKYKKELDLYKFRNKIFGRKKVPMNEKLEKEFIDKYSDKVDYSFENGTLVIDQKSFNKLYQKSVKPLKEWLSTKEAANEFNKLKMQEFWKENCLGSYQSWEMETILFYSKNHELDNMPLEKYFKKISLFNELPEVPEVIRYNRYGNPVYKVYVIAGTVVDKNKGKSLIYVATQDGVITVRIPKGSFTYYNNKVVHIEGKKKTILDPSWFDRGTKLVLIGFRRGQEFVLRKTGSQYKHTIMKILSCKNDKIYFQSEKVKED